MYDTSSQTMQSAIINFISPWKSRPEASYLLSTAGDLTCTRRVPARTLLGAGCDSPNNRVGPSTARGQGMASRLESIMLNYYSIVEFFHVIAIITMQVLLLCSNYAHFIASLSWVSWLWFICCHVTMCACTLLLFRHNALMLWVAVVPILCSA